MIRTRKPKLQPITGKTGPKSKYDPNFHPKMAHRLALLGLTRREIAAAFHIRVDSFEKWIMQHSELLESLREGQRIADANVARAIYRKATGFYQPVEVIISKNKQSEIVQMMKYFPPDTQAAIFWLKNRTRMNEFTWSDRVDFSLEWQEKQALDLATLDLSDLSEKELLLLQKLTGKIGTNKKLVQIPENQDVQEAEEIDSNDNITQYQKEEENHVTTS